MICLLPRIILKRTTFVRRMVSAVNLKDQEGYTKYSKDQEHKILQVLNESDISTLSRYNITKSRIKNIRQWLHQNGNIKAISEVQLIEGFSKKLAQKFFDSILDEAPIPLHNLNKRIKGQILQPILNESVIQSCRSVLAVSITVNSVCWTHIDKSNYEVLEWMYYSIEQQKDKKMQLTDIFNIATEVCERLPFADIYVMKAEATSLRAAGSDPNNPKVLSVNLQKAQMIAMIVALLNTRKTKNIETPDQPAQKVYFLRPTLPFRLYGTLVGNEHVSTDQTVEFILQEIKDRSKDNSKVYMSEQLKTMFRNQKELQKDMLGQCLLLALTFMDLCVYKNIDSIKKLLKRGE